MIEQIKAGLWGPYARMGLTVALVTLVLDQLHKWWMIGVVQIAPGQRIAVTPFFDWYYVKNIGISYSLFEGTGPLILAAFALFASLALWVWLNHAATTRLMASSLGLIIGGALGNGLDRITLGGVADFFSLHAFGFYWYVFNIADIAIVAGVIGLLYDQLRASRNTTAKVP